MAARAPASVPNLRHPVVLAHGLLGFSRVAVTLGFGAVGTSYFRGIPERLAAAGVRVFQTSVPPTGSIARRSAALRDAIRAEFGDAPVHIVAHSMGGLDARHAITHGGLGAQVVSLTTLSTPHRGSPVADRGTDVARRLHVLEMLRAIGGDSAAFEDLRTDACAAFNAETPDLPSVRYASVGATMPRPGIAMTLRGTFDLIREVDGDNDGLVSVNSAKWGEAFDVVTADHFDLIGWTPPVASPLGHPADVASIWDGVLARVAAWERG